jgi:uncharacterized membrane protein
MDKKYWVAVTVDNEGAVMAKVMDKRPTRGWVKGHWIVASVFTGCVAMAKTIVDQIEQLGPRADIRQAVAMLQA